MIARELALTYERGCWRARGTGLQLEHVELRGLEGLIAMLVGTAAAPVEVRLKFDMAALPRWLHQYHGHYCNYTLLVPRRADP